MLRTSEAVDRHDKNVFPADIESLDFGRALGQNEGDGQREDVGTLWGPGAHEQESPGSIISRKLQIWRKNNVQVSAAKAAEELDKLYENLPEMTVVDLTFKDMVDRNSPRTQRSPGKEERSPKNGVISPRASSGGNEKFALERVQGKHGWREKENNDPAYSVTKITPMPRFPTTADVFNPAKPGQLSLEQHENPVGKRLDPRSRTNQLQEGSYSPFTTPSSSFRRESVSISPKMSPHAPISQYKQEDPHESFGSGKELARSAKDLESRLEDKRARMSSAQDLQESLYYSTGNQSRPVDDLVVAPHINDCSICSATNLAFRTSCRACGKTFCLTCMNHKTRETQGDRQCKQDCAGRTTKERLAKTKTKTKTKKHSWKDCWRLFICFNVGYAH